MDISRDIIKMENNKGGEILDHQHDERLRWQYLLQVLYRISRAESVKEFGQVCFEQLQVITPFTKGLFFLASRKNGRVVHLSPMSYNFEETSIGKPPDAFISGDYPNSWVTFQYSPWSSVKLNSEIYDMKTFEKTDLYRDLYYPQDIYHAVQMVLIHDDVLLGIMAFFRPKSQPDFSVQDVEPLEMIKEHLALKLWYLLAQDGAVSAKGKSSELLLEAVGLTRREIEIAGLVRLGLDNEEICSRLYLSKSTLHKHFYNIYRKVGVTNRMQLYQYMISDASGKQ